MDRYPVTRPLMLPASPPLSAELIHLFESHGCRIERKAFHVELTVPAGTTRSEILPRMQLARFWLNFPDGWKIHEELDRSEVSLLAIPVPKRREE